MSISRHCEDCSAWKPVHGFIGECRALPPISVGTTIAPSAFTASVKWPQTRDGDWCRDGFQPKS